MSEKAYARYEACPLHAGALSRMDFPQALDRAEECPDCEVEWLGDQEPDDD